MSCQTITQTSTTTVTSSSLSTTFETTTTTGPAQTVTTSTATCASTTTVSDSSSVATTCASTAFSTFVTTIPGTTGTQTSTHVETVPVTFVSTATQLSTSCDNEPTSSTSSTTSEPTSDSTPPPPPPTSPPPPSTTTPRFTTQVSTTPVQLPNGSTVFSTVFVTQPVNDTSSDSQVQSTQPPPSLNDDNGGGNTGSAKRAGTIAGAVVGSVVGVALLAAIAFWMWKRSRRWDDIFDDSDDEGDGVARRSGWKAVGAPLKRLNTKKPRVDLDPIDPEPYHYGLVGSAAAMNPPSLDTSMSSRIPPSVQSSPFSHAHTPSAPDEIMYLLPAMGSDGGRLYPNGMVDPFATAVPPSIHPQAPSPRPMSARASPRPSTGSTDIPEIGASSTTVTGTAPGVIQIPGPSTRSAKPLSRPQSASSPVLVHQDAGRVPTNTAIEPPSYKD